MKFLKHFGTTQCFSHGLRGLSGFYASVFFVCFGCFVGTQATCCELSRKMAWQAVNDTNSQNLQSRFATAGSHQKNRGVRTGQTPRLEC